MPGHKKEILAISEKCMIQKCSCGALHMHYLFLSITLKNETLFAIMQKCYTWKEKQRKKDSCMHKHPFKIPLGLCTITISNDDFEEFNQVIQEASAKLLNLDDLLSHSLLNQKN